MTRESLIDKTLLTLAQLPESKITEVADFADFIFKKYEDEILQKGIEKMVSNSKTFSYLQNEEVIYTFEDLKESYK